MRAPGHDGPSPATGKSVDFPVPVWLPGTAWLAKGTPRGDIMFNLVDIMDGEAIRWRKMTDFHLEIVPAEDSLPNRRFYVRAYTAEYRGVELVKELWIDRDGNVLRSSVEALNPRTGQFVSVNFSTSGACADVGTENASRIEMSE